MNAIESETRIYVASLADYNAGRLHGAWIDADQEPEEIEAAVKAMLAESKEPNAEEWAIHDYELGGCKIGESESFVIVAAIARMVEKHGDAFVAWFNHQDRDVDDYGDFEDDYLGEYDSLEDYAAEYAESTGLLSEVPESLRYYFDFEAYGRDMELNGDVWTERGVYVFRNT